jgi:predicted phage tail protein
VTAILGAVLYYAGGVVSAWNPVIGAGMQGIGMSMMLGGVAQLLAGSPKGMFNPSTTTSDIETFTFNSPTATTGQGGSVPVLYGQPGLRPCDQCGHRRPDLAGQGLRGCCP